MRILKSFAILTVGLAAMPLSAAEPPARATDVPAADQGQAIEASVALKQRGDDLVRLINGEVEPAQIFSSDVLAKVPAARFVAIVGAVRSKYGRALGVGAIEAESPNMGQVLITFEQTQLPIRVGVQPAAPNLIAALQF